METGLSDRVALVTGASGAIGRAAAAHLAAEGAAVAVAWHTNQDGAREVVDAITRAGGRALAVHLDQADPATVPGVLDEITGRLGAVAVLVANAVQWPSFDAGEISGLTTSLTVNTVGTAALIDAALPAMRDAGWGRVVVVSTDIVEQPMAGPLAYATAKGALETAARVLAVREARHGILTNVVRPGFTLTDRALTAPFLGPEAVASESRRTPTGRICTPDDVASAITYLASAANGHVNGQTVSLAGGRELVR
ncbi:putative short-chain dehydrogenase [Actinoplanes missouriensis 431]|uniref:Putative short-chain dehydrogenase n=1 Tax=Actinoplanes missouriensis (strain ATCC 14538 / DSM 43046 / CBS 188.64 / JCM 3121 / NBRC 102363 / NCIMB 12654 / NRRL B-3342 / UNCC 431) TaxID=512565 RepID=I0H6X3_ACTM4|nr:SDR family oxidoreductase [Actinoplanes missouriensis]BAL88760.1 putative short-chain dehydrogenase [Actinoplanes missouriensis 431]